MHGGLKTPHAREHPLHRVRGHRAATARSAAQGSGRDPGAGRLRRARHRRQDPGGALRARAAACRTSASASACRWRSSSSARHVLGLDDANSTEFNRATPHPVIALITEWQDQTRGAQTRDEASDMGGTMRLGRAGSAARGRHACARDLRHATSITERHRHRYEFNNNYLDRYSHGGPALLRLLARRPGGDDRAAEPSVVRRDASSTPSSPRRRATAIRCSPASSAPRAHRAAARRPRAAAARGAAHETRRIRGRRSTSRSS